MPERRPPLFRQHDKNEHHILFEEIVKFNVNLKLSNQLNLIKRFNLDFV